jgi:hypothetical protein
MIQVNKKRVFAITTDNGVCDQSKRLAIEVCADVDIETGTKEEVLDAIESIDQSLDILNDLKLASVVEASKRFGRLFRCTECNSACEENDMAWDPAQSTVESRDAICIECYHTSHLGQPYHTKGPRKYFFVRINTELTYFKRVDVVECPTGKQVHALVKQALGKSTKLSGLIYRVTAIENDNKLVFTKATQGYLGEICAVVKH